MIDYEVKNLFPDSDTVKIEVLDFHVKTKKEHKEFTITVSRDENSKVFINVASAEESTTTILGEEGITNKL